MLSDRSSRLGSLGAPGLAILLTLTAMAAFAIMDGLTKITSQTVPIPVIMWIRNLFFTAVAIWLMRRQFPDRPLREMAHSGRPGLQFSRALLLIVESAMYMVAFKLLPLADVHAVSAMAPLIIMALSVPVLGEKVGPRRWAAVAIGFVGVLIIVRPGFTTLDPAMLIALGAAALWGIYQVMVRLCARHDSPETTTLWTSMIGLGVTSVLAPLYWVWPSASTWVLLLTIAALGAFAHIAYIRALTYAEASALQPYSYTLFVWAVVVGYLMFGDWPDVATLVGATVVIAAGVYAWHRERVRARETAGD